MPKHTAKRQALMLVLAGTVAVWAVTGSVPGISPAAAAESATESVVYAVSTLVSMAITFMNVMMWVLFRLLAIVLDPNLIFDVRDNGSSALYDMLRGIWQFSRDLVNVGFAFMLVYGAVMTILKSSGEFVKEYARKFVIAVVAVNFSWFVPQVIFDVSQIAAATIYQIPSLLQNAVDCQIPSDRNPAEKKPCEIITKVVFFEHAEPISDQLNAFVGPIDPDNPPNGWRCPLEGVVCYQYTPMDSPDLNIRPDLKVINGLVVNHARLRTLASVVQPPPGDLAGDDLKAMKELLVYLMKLMLVLALHVALFFPVLAMTFAFFIRIPILWLTMAFMPFVFLEFVLGGKFFKNFSPMEKIWNGFLGAVLLPVMVAIPFTIGFIILNAFGSITNPPQALTEINESIPLFVGVSDLWQLLWLGLALGILWTQVFAAIGSFKAAEPITKAIQGFGKGMGSLAVSAPLNVPLPGINISANQAMQLGNPSRWTKALDKQPGDDRGILARVWGQARPDHVTRAQQAITTETINNDLKVHIDRIVTAPNTDAGRQTSQQSLDRIIDKIKERHGNDLRGVSDEALIQGLLNHQSDLTDDQQAAIRQALRQRTNPTPPPPPAQNPPPPPNANPPAAGGATP